MGYEYLNTIPETEIDEVIKSSVKNLLPIPSEYEVTFDDESECDVPVKDESSQVFTTFSNPLFDDNDDFTSSDDESISDEDVPMEEFKVYSNPLFDDEEINSDKTDLHYFNAESDFVESLSNEDILIDSSPKFDYLEEFFGALMPTSIADEEHIRREHEEYISLIEKLLAINPFPRPLENFQSNTIVETLPTSPILVEDSDSLREEIDIFVDTNDLLPPGIESDDYDSEGEIHDTVGFEFNQNQKNQYFGSLIDTDKFHEIPHSYHNKENLVNHVDNNYHYSFGYNLVPAHRQAETVVDNHNYNVNHSRITHTSKSHIEVVEGD
nr:hypothetical protein [Tanacetum cinerariifolium]